jgi:hypothetical protein
MAPLLQKILLVIDVVGLLKVEHFDPEKFSSIPMLSRSKTRRESPTDSSSTARNPTDQSSNPYRPLSPSNRQSALSRLPQATYELNWSSGLRASKNVSPTNRQFHAASNIGRLERELQSTTQSESGPPRNISPTFHRYSANFNPERPTATPQFLEMQPDSNIATSDYRIQLTSVHQDYFGNKLSTNQRQEEHLSHRQLSSHSIRNSVFSGRLDNAGASINTDDVSVLENIDRHVIVSGFVREFIDSQRGILEIRKVGANHVLSEPVPGKINVCFKCFILLLTISPM